MTDRPTTQQLDEIETRANAATPGPWGVYESGYVIEIAADLEETGHGYRARRGIARLDEEPLDNDPTHREWTAEEDWAQVQADAEFIAHAPEDVRALLAEIRRLQAQRRYLLDQLAKRDAETGAGDRALRESLGSEQAPDTLPAWLRQRFTASGIAWEHLDDGERAYWEHHARAVRRAVARNGFKPRAEETHVVADDSDDPEHVDDCPGCGPVSPAAAGGVNGHDA